MSGLGTVGLHVASPSPDDTTFGAGPDVSQSPDLALARLYGTQAVHHEPVQLVKVLFHVADRKYLRRPAKLAFIKVAVHGIYGFDKCRIPTADRSPLDFVLEGLDAGRRERDHAALDAEAEELEPLVRSQELDLFGLSLMVFSSRRF